MQNQFVSPFFAPIRSGAATVRDLFAAALIAADPTSFTARAVRLRYSDNNGRSHPVWIIALGKAAFTMARAAVQELSDRGIGIAGGLVVGPSHDASPHAAIISFVGDHPLPGENSFAAARALGQLCDRISINDRVFVLLSGGASSLVAAPVHGVEPADFVTLCDVLLRSGLDIGRMNAIRKRFLRWGAGRLAARMPRLKSSPA